MTQAEVIAALKKEGYEYLGLVESQQFTYQEHDAGGVPRVRTTGLCTYLHFERSRTHNFVNAYDDVAVPLDSSGRADEVLQRVSLTGL